jgi:hypothetical protein
MRTKNTTVRNSNNKIIEHGRSFERVGDENIHTLIDENSERTHGKMMQETMGMSK